MHYFYFSFSQLDVCMTCIHRRRCAVVETLAEKHFNLAFQILHEFNLPGSLHFLIQYYSGFLANSILFLCSITCLLVRMD